MKFEGRCGYYSDGFGARPRSHTVCSITLLDTSRPRSFRRSHDIVDLSIVVCRLDTVGKPETAIVPASLSRALWPCRLEGRVPSPSTLPASSAYSHYPPTTSVPPMTSSPLSFLIQSITHYHASFRRPHTLPPSKSFPRWASIPIRSTNPRKPV